MLRRTCHLVYRNFHPFETINRACMAILTFIISLEASRKHGRFVGPLKWFHHLQICLDKWRKSSLDLMWYRFLHIMGAG